MVTLKHINVAPRIYYLHAPNNAHRGRQVVEGVILKIFDVIIDTNPWSGAT